MTVVVVSEAEFRRLRGLKPVGSKAATTENAKEQPAIKFAEPAKPPPETPRQRNERAKADILRADPLAEQKACTSSFHPAWTFEQTAADLMRVVSNAWEASMDARNNRFTLCDPTRLHMQLAAWDRGRLSLQEIAIDPPFYAAMMRQLAPDSYRYTNRVAHWWLTPFGTTRDKMAAHVRTFVPDDARFFTADRDELPREQWSVEALVNHLHNIALQGDEHPRPFVTKPIADCLREVFNNSRPSKPQQQQQQGSRAPKDGNWRQGPMEDSDGNIVIGKRFNKR